MKLRYEKSIRVLTDIMGYCRLMGGEEFGIDFSMKNRTTKMRITVQLPGADPKKLKELDTMLNIPRQREVEHYYWTLAGEEEIDNELSLAGMMLDSAVVTYADGVLTIEAERKDLTSED